MEVIGVTADMAPLSGKGVRYGAFGGVGMTAMVVEVLLGVGGFDVERGAEMTMFNMDIDLWRADKTLFHKIKCREGIIHIEVGINNSPKRYLFNLVKGYQYF